MTPTQIIAAIALAIGATAGGAGAWQWQSGRVAAAQLELSNERLDRANERIAIQRAARATADRLTSAVSKAQTDASIRTAALAAVVDRSRSELDRLRIASADAVRNAHSGLDACTSTLATHSQLLTQCSKRLVEVAHDADQWAIHAMMLQDGWPR